MEKAVIQALSDLIPTFNQRLPSDLITLATSLLAQSRIQARNLKAEEEIARSYACAQLACERLKRSLQLPTIVSRPPCQPRIYQKLYRYFDALLPTGTRRRGRSQAQAQAQAQDQKDPPDISPGHNLGQHSLINNSNSVVAHASPETTPGRKRITRTSQVSKVSIPMWVTRSIRRLCAINNFLGATPHVLAGVYSALSTASTITCSSPQSSSKSRSKGEVLALIVALYLCVCARMRGKSVDGRDFLHDIDPTLQQLLEIEPMPPAELSPNDKDVGACLIDLKACHLFNLDWWNNIAVIPSATAFRATHALGDESENDGGEDKLCYQPMKKKALVEDSRITLYPGLGTMMQDKVDYLCAERQADYIGWRATILSRLGKSDQQ